MKKKIGIVLVLLAHLAVGTAVAQSVCYFTEGVTISKHGNFVCYTNTNDIDVTVKRIVYYEGGKDGPNTVTVPAKTKKSQKFPGTVLNVEQCW